MSHHLNDQSHRSLAALLLLIICALFFLSGIHKIPVVDQDEARFAQTSKQMLESHQPLLLYFQETPRHLKPPGIYWTQALSTKLTQQAPYQKIYSYRLPSVIGATLAVLLLFYCFCSVVGSLTAFVASLLLASSLLLVVEAHMATADALLLATVVAMQAGLYRVYASFKQAKTCSIAWPCLFWMGLALGVLVKGVTPIYGGLTIIGLCLLDRNIIWLKRLYPLRGLLLTALFTLIWLATISTASHSNFLWQMIHQDLLPKIASNQQGHGGYPGYYLIAFSLIFWPGSFFILNGVFYFFTQRQTLLYRFLLVWLISVWLVFAFLVRVKLPEYSLPLFPALALLAATFLINRQQQMGNDKTCAAQRFVRIILTLIWWAYTLAFAAAFIVISYQANHSQLTAAIFTAAILLLSAVAIQWCFCLKKLIPLLVSIILAGAIFYISAFHFFLPSLNNLFISQKVKQALQQQHVELSQVSPLIASDYTEPSLVFSLGTRRVVLTANYQQLKQQLLARPRAIILFSQQHQADFKHWSTQQHLQWQCLSSIDGFNYERGRQVHLWLLAVYREKS